MNIAKYVFDLINIEVYIVVDVVELKVEELQPILNESVDELIHFLAIKEEIPAEEVNEFISFSFDYDGKIGLINPFATWKGGNSR